MVQSESPISFIVCTRSSLTDANQVEMYVLKTDSRLGKFRGLGSTCVQHFELIAGSLDPLHGRDAYARAAAAADERINVLKHAQCRVAVAVEDCRRAPPKLFDLPSLQKTCNFSSVKPGSAPRNTG